MQIDSSTWKTIKVTSAPNPAKGSADNSCSFMLFTAWLEWERGWPIRPTHRRSDRRRYVHSTAPFETTVSRRSSCAQNGLAAPTTTFDPKGRGERLPHGRGRIPGGRAGDVLFRARRTRRPG